MSLNWNGDKLKARMRRAKVEAINEIMAEVVQEAKAKHPGQRSVTGAAERSVQIVEPAKSTAKGAGGIWGAKGVRYVPILEYNRGAFLRAAESRL